MCSAIKKAGLRLPNANLKKQLKTRKLNRKQKGRNVILFQALFQPDARLIFLSILDKRIEKFEAEV